MTSKKVIRNYVFAPLFNENNCLKVLLQEYLKKALLNRWMYVNFVYNALSFADERIG